MILLVQGPVPHIAFDLKNTGVDGEGTVRLARPIRVVGTAQINRRRIEKSVVRFVRRWCGRGRIVTVTERGMRAEHNEANGDQIFHERDQGRGLSMNHVQNK